MIRSHHLICFAVAASQVAVFSIASAQSDTASTRLRPLGSQSVVDQFQSNRIHGASGPVTAVKPTVEAVRNETAYWQTEQAVGAQGESVRQTVWMQNGFAPPPLDGGGLPLPSTPPDAALLQPGVGPTAPGATAFPTPGLASPGPAPTQPISPPTNSLPPRALPVPPITPMQSGGGIIASSSDQTPIPQPQLNADAFARMDNCRLVTPPSSYNAAFGYGCGQVQPSGYATNITGPVTQSPGINPGSLPPELPSGAKYVPASIPPPQVAPPPTVPQAVAPARALWSHGQENYIVQVGQGLWGQPVAYVPGQRCKNWFRYIFP